jgi:hypothetical protein
MPAIPALITAGGYLGGQFMANKAASSAQKNAMQRTPEELGLIRSQTATSDALRKQGGELFQTAMPGVQSSLNYYQTLLNGNRQARTNAVAPEAGDQAQAFQGSEGAIKRNLTGGERDQALAENARQRAGAISRLTTGVRPAAASGIAGLAPGLINSGTSAEGGSANIVGNLLGNETSNRQDANAYGFQAGQNTAAGIGALVSQILGTFGKGNKSNLVSRPTVPNSTTWMPSGNSGSQIAY